MPLLKNPVIDRDTRAFGPGRGCDSPSGLKPKRASTVDIQNSLKVDGILAHQTYCEGGHEAHLRVALVNFLKRLVLVLERRPKSAK
jgi:hypothetical protein